MRNGLLVLFGLMIFIHCSALKRDSGIRQTLNCCVPDVSFVGGSTGF